jgi:hypothetical protein
LLTLQRKVVRCTRCPELREYCAEVGRTKRKAYVEYLHQLSEKGPLVFDGPDGRIEEFKAAFGEDLERLDRDFLRYVERLGR